MTESRNLICLKVFLFDEISRCDILPGPFVLPCLLSGGSLSVSTVLCVSRAFAPSPLAPGRRVAVTARSLNPRRPEEGAPVVTVTTLIRTEQTPTETTKLTFMSSDKEQRSKDCHRPPGMGHYGPPRSGWEGRGEGESRGPRIIS